MATSTSPVFNWPLYDHTVSPPVPLVGGKIFTYLAGTSTKLAAWKDEAQTVAHTNPIILGADGLAPDLIRLSNGLKYKLVLAPANDTDPPGSPIRTYDNILGVTDVLVASSTASEWQVQSLTGLTVVSTVSFSCSGDERTNLHINRRLKIVAATTVYGQIIRSVFAVGPGTTTVTLALDSGSLSGGITSVSVGINSHVDPSDPKTQTPPGWQMVAEAGLIRVKERDSKYIMVRTDGVFTPRLIGTLEAGSTNVMVNGVAGQSLVDNTHYLVYVVDVAGVLTIDYRTAPSGHQPDPVTGVEILSLDTNRTLVGQLLFGKIAPGAISSQLTRSWANRNRYLITTNATLIGTPTFTSTTLALISATIKMHSMVWAGEIVAAGYSGSISNNTTGQSCSLAVRISGVDGATFDFHSPSANQRGTITAVATGVGNTGSVDAALEIDLFGKVSANTGTLHAASGFVMVGGFF